MHACLYVSVYACLYVCTLALLVNILMVLCNQFMNCELAYPRMLLLTLCSGGSWQGQDGGDVGSCLLQHFLMRCRLTQLLPPHCMFHCHVTVPLLLQYRGTSYVGPVQLVPDPHALRSYWTIRIGILFQDCAPVSFRSYTFSSILLSLYNTPHSWERASLCPWGLQFSADFHFQCTVSHSLL